MRIESLRNIVSLNLLDQLKEYTFDHWDPNYAYRLIIDWDDEASNLSSTEHLEKDASPLQHSLLEDMDKVPRLQDNKYAFRY